MTGNQVQYSTCTTKFVPKQHGHELSFRMEETPADDCELGTRREKVTVTFGPSTNQTTFMLAIFIIT